MSVAALREENRILKEKNERLTITVSNLSLENNKKEELIKLLRHLLFGSKSEKMTKEDKKTASLFNEAEDTAFQQNDEKQKEIVTQKTEVAPHTRTIKKKSDVGRKPFDPALPRTVIEYDISDEEKICPCGCEMKCIGEDVSERAKIHPPKVEIIQERKKKYVCTACEGLEREDEKGVVTAEGVKHLIPGSCADESLLAWSIAEKFEFALPFYRQSIRFSQIGIPIPRATLSNLAIQTANRCKGLYELLIETIRSGEVINADETRVQVLKEPGRKNETKSWMWLFLGGPPEKKCAVFQYDTSRSHEIPHDFLKNYSGWLQTDDYEAYHTALKEIHAGCEKKIHHVLCWAHVRRLFFQYWKESKDEDAKDIIDQIRNLFELEELRSDFSRKGFVKHRKLYAESIFKTLYERLTELYRQLPPSLGFGKAIRYTLDNWEQLKLYVDHWEITPSNNIAERAIRPFAVGRKNWLFAGSPAGAEASAILYSIIESAKLSSLSPIKYLYYIFRKIPYCKTKEELQTLLPFNVDPQVLHQDWE